MGYMVLSPENPNLNNSHEKLIFRKELLWDGDVYRFSADKETLLKVAQKISEAFGKRPYEIKQILESIQKGQEYRVDGNTFSLNMYQEKLVFDNRNSRGNLEYRKQMKEIVDSL